jgi:ABC-2 type transport system permease protein
MKINFQMIISILKRDLRLYFTNPTGYVFITIFIFLSAYAAFWSDRFFFNNLANLDQLNGVFPLLLILFVPALTMGVWANERKEGTDELLLTLPATDLEVVLGKYLSILGIYTASLILAFLSQILILAWLGRPDPGLMIGNYLGYWLLGATFIAVGMFASLLTSNVTISFILGALFSAFFAYIDLFGGLFGEGVRNFLAPLGVVGYFTDFARGVVSFSALLYFISLTAVMLYLNILLISRRHWPQEADGYKMSYHHLVRTIAIIIAVISFNAVLGRLSLRLDVTAEQLHSLSSETHKILKGLPENRPVFIQAYVSREVPQQFVQTRENLLGFLNEIDAEAGNKVQVLIHDTEPFTPEARDAREKFGILPRETLDPRSSKSSVMQVFMGVAFTCGAEEEVIPFFDRGLPTEYELVRSIRVVARTERKKIGVLVTEAKVFGGFDFQAGSTTPKWQVVGELEKQYEVVRISATSPISEELNALLVPMPSTLPQEEMDNLLAYMETGVPTLLLVDPLPVVNVNIAPSERAGADRNPFMNQGGPPPKDKGNINVFMNKLGINWNIAQIVWDAYNPHPDFATLPPEIVFIGRGNENPESFNKAKKSTADLQELVLMFPGYLNKASNADVEFNPLIKSAVVSGTQQYNRMVQRHFLFGPQLNLRGLPHYPNEVDYTLAAAVKSAVSTAADTSGSASVGGGKNLNLIVIADIDFISEQFFEIRKQGVGNLNFDNITFFLNCMDELAGDESVIALRNRRVKHRTLEFVEAQSLEHEKQRAQDEQQAESEAQIALSEAQGRLNERVSEVQQRTDLDAQTKQIMAENIREVEQRKFDALKKNIEAEKEAKIAASKERMEAQIRAIQSGIKITAVVLPPIPVLVIGVIIFIRRRRREAEGAAAARRLRS